MSSQHTAEDEPIDDPSKVILPPVDTSNDIYHGLTWKELLLLAPAVGLGLITFIAWIHGRLTVLVVTIPLTFIAIVGAFLILQSARWYSSPRERLEEWVGYRLLRSRLPFGYETLLGRLHHGVRRFAADGSVIMTDGRRVAMILIDGTNTDRLSESTRQQLVGALASGIDAELGGGEWSFYSTTRNASTSDVADAREERGIDGWRAGLSDLEQRVLVESADWLREDDIDWNSRKFTHAVEVSVAGTPTQSNGFMGDILDMIGLGNAAAPDDDEDLRETADLLTDRVEDAMSAVNRVEDVSCRCATSAELSQIALTRWTGTENTPGETLLESFESKANGAAHTPAQRMLTPSYFDVQKTTVETGNRLSRTFWISEWPPSPDDLLFEDLYAFDGEDLGSDVDLDVKINYTPVSREQAVTDLEAIVPGIQAKLLEREAEMDLTAHTIKSKEGAYLAAYVLASNRYDVHPWRMNAYVTIHADTHQGLDDASDVVRKRLQARNCHPIAPGRSQYKASIAGGPFTRDRYREETRNEKSFLTFGTGAATLFPFDSDDVEDEDGLQYGRHGHTGVMNFASPFERGTAPHMLTIGVSRSGKTFWASMAYLYWFLQRDDRTLIVCDTQRGFEGLTKLLGGEHIEIGGEDAQINPMAMSTASAAQFFAGILRTQGVDPSDLLSGIEQAVATTHRRFGITGQSDLSEADPEDVPTVADFLETLKRIQEEPEAHTHFGTDLEADLKREEVAGILNKLTGFLEGGKYEHLLNAQGKGIPHDARMIYLDMSAYQDDDGVEKAVLQHLMLGQLSELIKTTPGETVALFDEAHNLLHSEEMVEWLQKAAREWARYEAALHFVTQSTQEFVKRAKGVGEGQENDRQTIYEQCSTVQVFNSPRTDEETLREIGLETDELIETVQEGLIPARANKNCTTCLAAFNDRQGWFEYLVEAPPLVAHILEYQEREHGDFEEYIEGFDGGDTDETDGIDEPLPRLSLEFDGEDDLSLPEVAD